MTPQEQKEISTPTMLLGLLFTNLSNAHTYAGNLTNEKGISVTAKNLMRHMETRIKASINHLRLNVAAESRHLLDEQLLDPEVSLQIEAIKDLTLRMDKERRDRVEAFADQQLQEFYDNLPIRKQ